MVDRAVQEGASDRALVAAARAGSASAFALLVERYQAPLLRTLARLCGDRERATDLAQDAFEAAFRDLDRLADAGRFAPWLYGIARNRWRADARRRRLRRVVSLDWLVARGPGDALADPRELAEAVVTRAAVGRALDALRPAEREVLLLRREWGFACVEVAAILGITPAAARRRLARATARFRARYRALAAEGEGDGDDALL